MHTALVWSAALLIGVVSALAIQIVAPMTVFGWVFCVGMFTVVLAHALYPTLTLRRGSIRLRHAIRRSLRKGEWSRPVGVGHLRRMTVGAVACSAAIVLYQTFWHPSATQAAAPDGLGPGSAMLLSAWSPSSRSPVMNVAVAAAESDTALAARDAAIEPAPSKREATRPGWAWLVDLIFMPPEPAA